MEGFWIRRIGVMGAVCGTLGGLIKLLSRTILSGLL